MVMRTGSVDRSPEAAPPRDALPRLVRRLLQYAARQWVRSTAVLGLLLGGLLVGLSLAPAALAVQVRPQIATFGSDGTANSTFGLYSANQLAFNQTSSTLYVLNTAPNEIHGFDVSVPGTYAPLSGLPGSGFPISVAADGGEPDISVDAGSGNLYYLSESSGLYGFDATGRGLSGFPISSFGDPCGSGVDPSGHIWVGDYATSSVKKYDASGSSLGEVDVSAQGHPCHVAFDANADMYLAMYAGAVWKYTAASGYAAGSAVEIDSGSAKAIAVDRTTHDLYVAHGTAVKAYDSSGTLRSTFADDIPVPGASLRGVAVNEASGEVYVSERTGGQVHVYGPLVTLPDVTTGTASGVTTISATLGGTVDPDAVALTDCHFDYGITDAYGQSVPCSPAAGSIPADTNTHPVTAAVNGLTPGQVYHFRLVAGNANGPNRGGDQTFDTGAAINAQTIVSVGTDTVSLSAKINPKGLATSYHVDYGTTTAYGQSTAESTPIGSDDSDHLVTTQLTDLQPGATYHFRFVATNTAGTTDGPDGRFATVLPPAAAGPDTCPNAALRYGYGASLPDCRAYEQATAIDKNGTNPQTTWNGIQAAEDGGGITFFTRASLPGGTGAAQFTSYVATRSSDGWTTQGLLPPGNAGQEAYMRGWTPSLAQSFATAVKAGAGTTLLARNTHDGSLKTVVPYTTASGGTNLLFTGASRDGSMVFFQDQKGAPLTPDTVAGKDNAYVWDRATGVVSLVGVLPDSACGSPPCTPAGGSFAGAYNWWDGSVSSGGAGDMFFTQAHHVISNSGHRVYFTAGGTGALYLRRDPASPTASTVQVSSSQKTNGAGPGGTDANGPQPAAFMMATPDGSQAFFTSPEELTNDANTGTSDQGNDLYRYDAASDSLTDLTPDSSDANGADVQGVVGISDDGAYVYFAANGDLDGSGPAEPGTCSPSGLGSSSWIGECSLYVWHNGTSTFVAKINASGATDARLGSWSDASNWAPRGKNISGGAPVINTGRVSTNGQVLVFRSQRKLTAYENAGTPEYYRYDVATGRLGCVSCNPSGAAASNAPELTSQTAFAGIDIQGIVTRNMSASGNQFFFQTADALLPQDTNGVTDVYEWEADGSGSCRSAVDGDGCLYLLSTGKSPEPSVLGDVSASGDEAFIFTYQPLVGQDQDQLIDVYAVRVHGGLASQDPPSVVPCSGDACRPGRGSDPGPMAAAGSLSFWGSTPLTPVTEKPKTTKAKVSVSRPKTTSGTRASVRVRVSGAGRIRVSGSGLRRATKTVKKAGTYRLTVRLSSRASRRLKRRHRVKVRATVRFTPVRGASRRVRVSLTYRTASHRRRSASSRATRRATVLSLDARKGR